VNEPISKEVDGKMRRGHHTYKKFHLADKLPGFITSLVNPNNFIIEEDSWNFVTIGNTVYKNPNYMGEDFFIIVESTNIDGDRGAGDNPLNLPPEDLAIRSVILLDIATDEPLSSFYKTHYQDNPTKCRSAKSGQEALKPDWLKTYSGPIMTVYKLVRTYFKFFGLQTWIERMIVSNQNDYLLIFHRKLFCLMDGWFGMTYDELEELEAETVEELNRLRLHCNKRGLGTRSKPVPASMPRKRRERPTAAAAAQTEQPEETKEPPRLRVNFVDRQQQLSLVSSLMKPAVEEVIDDSRHLIVIRGYHRDLVLTLPPFRNGEAQDKIAAEKED